MESVLGRAAEEAVIQFEYPEPGYVDRYREYLHAPYTFGCERTVLTGSPRTSPTAANSTGDTEAYRVAQDLCNSLLAQTPAAKRSMSDRVRTLLLAQPRVSVTEDEVARALFVSKRTLVRRLAKENSTYREIKAQVVSDLARRCLLESRQSMDSIATLLGYCDAAAFRKAFRNRHGMAPGEYREQFRILSIDQH